MRLRNITLTALVLAATAIVPATANATVFDESWAAGKVERTATRHWPSYDFVADCQPEGRRGRFWCDVIGQHGDCFVEGHADVKTTRRRGWVYWDVWLRGMNRTCY